MIAALRDGGEVDGAGAAGGFDTRNLDVGDALVVLAEEGGEEGSTLVIAERKTLPDLCASIKDGRYREQKARLLEQARLQGAAAVYIIEGYEGFGAGLRGAATRGGLHPAALQTCVCQMTFRDGIRVMFTRDVPDTAECLLALWRRAHKPSSFGPGASAGRATEEGSPAVSAVSTALLVHAKRGRNISPPLCFRMQLCQIPGVSEKIAGSIAAHWRTMAAFYARMGPLDVEARVRALMEVPLVGNKNARTIEGFMFVEGEGGEGG